MKKILSLLIVILLLSSFGLSAFAGTLTVRTAVGGSVSPPGPFSSEDPDDPVDLTAVPDVANGYYFVQWVYSKSDGTSGISDHKTESFNIYDRTVTPVFEKLS